MWYVITAISYRCFVGKSCRIYKVQQKISLVVGLKLEAHPLTVATAATLYHRFIKEATLQGYDNYVRTNDID